MIYKDLEIEVERKRIRTLRLSVKPDGRIMLSVPLLTPESVVERFLSAHYGWMQRSRQKMLQRAAEQQQIRYESGEKHLFFGRPLPLRVEDERGRESVAFYEDEIVMYCHSDRTMEQRKKILYQGYYQQFKPVLQRLFDKWSCKLDEHGIEYTVRLTKSQWGSCMPRLRKMCFNVDMARLPEDCIEYVVIHEFSHLTYCNHSPAFWALVDRHLAAEGLIDSKAMRAKIKQVTKPQ